MMKKSILRQVTRIAVQALVPVIVGTSVGIDCQAEPIRKDIPIDGFNPRYASGTRFQPHSNHLLAGETGRQFHTYMRLMVPPANVRPPKVRSSAAQPDTTAPPFTGYFFETPQSLQCVYGLTTVVRGCNPNAINLATLNTGAKAVAIVGAYDYTAAASDLAVFSSQFGLPAPSPSNFQVVYASGARPADGSGSGWDLEAALDIEWAHAMAPNAKIYLVEAASNFDNDLFQAVSVAAALVVKAGGGEVSMSWGGRGV